MEEILIVDHDHFELSANQYLGTVHPTGYSFIESFTCDTNIACWIYSVNENRISKTIGMVQGQNTTIVTYKNLSGGAIGLQLVPLLVYRDYYALFHKNERFNFYTQAISEQYLKIYAGYGAHPLFIKFSKVTWKEEHNWFYNLQYEREKERGSDFEEDTICIGKALIGPGNNDTMQIVFSTEEIASKDFQFLPSAPFLPALPIFVNDLVTSGNQFYCKQAQHPWQNNYCRLPLVCRLGPRYHDSHS